MTDRVRCRLCDRDMAITTDRLIRVHRDTHARRCPGSGTPAYTTGRIVDALGPRQLLVLRGMALGWTDRRIGRELGLSTHTVKTHAARLFRALDASGRAHAVAIGYETGMLRPTTDTTDTTETQ